MSDELRLLVAAAPIVVVLLLLVVRVPSLWAGVAGLAVALAGAALAFPVDGAQATATLTGLGPLVVEVALILLGGVGLAEGMARSGAQDRIALWLGEAEQGSERGVAPSADTGADRTIMLLLLVYGMTPFMESVTGFGLGVVITAPLLIRLGLTPARAVVTGLLGLVTVPWGSLAPGTLVAAQLGGVGFTELGIATALVTPIVMAVSAAVVLRLNVRCIRLPDVALAALTIAVATFALLAAHALVGPPLAGVAAGAAVVAALLAVLRIRRGALPRGDRALGRALVPYAVLTAGILGATGLLALITALTDAAASGAEPGSSGADAWGWLTSPALWSLVAASVGAAMAPIGGSARRALLLAALRRWVPIAGNAVVFLLMGIVLATAGMAGHLASAAASIGPGFVAAVPLLGALGGYLTGSNTGAAAMLSSATASAAAGLGVSPLAVLAGQNAAGSFAIIASPPRIALAIGVALPPGQRLPRRMLLVLLGAVTVAALLLGPAMLLVA